MWNGAAEALKAKPAIIIARPSTSSESWVSLAAAILSKLSWPGRAVDERRAEEQRRRADGADHEVLQPRLERADEVDVDRAHHVERDREPLEPEEERHQVRRLHEERHPGARGCEQRVVLGDVLLAHPLAVGDEHGDEPAARDDDLRGRGPAVAVDRVARRSRRRAGSSRRRGSRTRTPSRSRAPQTTAEAARRDALGQKTATSSSSATAASSDSDGESANQSTCGFWITGSPRSEALSCGRRRARTERMAADRVRPGREHEQDRDERHDDGELAAAQVERGVADGRSRRRGAAPPRSAGARTSPRARSRPRRRPPSPSPPGRRRPGSGTRRRSSRRAARRAPSRRPSSGSSRATGRPRAIPPSSDELPGRGAALDHPGEQEHRHREQAVVDHLQHGAVEAEVVGGEEAEA